MVFVVVLLILRSITSFKAFKQAVVWKRYRLECHLKHKKAGSVAVECRHIPAFYVSYVFFLKKVKASFMLNTSQYETSAKSNGTPTYQCCCHGIWTLIFPAAAFWRRPF